MRANGPMQLADLLRSKAARFCAFVFLGLLMAACPGALHAQAQPSSATNQGQKQPPAKPKQKTPQSESAAAQPNSPAQKPDQGQEQGQGQDDQSLQPDPLANPVDPPPTPEEPAASDSDISAPASPSVSAPPAAFPGQPAPQPSASGIPAQVAPSGPILSPAPPAARPAMVAQTPRPAAAQPVARFNPPPVPPPAKAGDPHRQQINNECANLLAMANTLKAAVDKTTKDELSVTVVRTAGQIEQLAHQVKDEMRPTVSKN